MSGSMSVASSLAILAILSLLSLLQRFLALIITALANPNTIADHKDTNKNELQVTFGVKIECVLGCHQSLLQAQLDRAGDPSLIIRSLTPYQRQELRTGGNNYLLAHPQYMGWALTSQVLWHEDRQPPLHDVYTTAHRQFGFRPYADEIFTVAQQLLPGPLDTHSLRTSGKRTDFRRWHLCEDASIVGVDAAALTAQLGSRMINVAEWDSHGIELVSRVLPLSSASFAEIATHLALLKGDRTSLHGAFPTAHCGLHVHVGLATPPNQDSSTGHPTFDLPTLQHLAYMLFMYERAISTIHQPSRREGSPTADKDIITNLENIQEQALNLEYTAEADLAAAHRSRPLTPPASDASPDKEFTWDAAPLPFLDDDESWPEDDDVNTTYTLARTLIFASSQTIPSLTALMCGSSKHHIVNFLYAARTDGLPRTLEFRQHAGCLDADVVRAWVLFVVALVRCAHRMAGKMGAMEGYSGSGYPCVEREGGKGGIAELMNLVGFGREERAVLWRRIVEFAAEEER